MPYTECGCLNDYHCPQCPNGPDGVLHEDSCSNCTCGAPNGFSHTLDCPVDSVEGKHLAAPLMGDPWAHRSTGMQCRTCMWFVTKVAISNQGPDGEAKLGRCRRHSPAAGQKLGFPVVFPHDWCGDHKLDESKV